MVQGLQQSCRCAHVLRVGKMGGCALITPPVGAIGLWGHDRGARARWGMCAGEAHGITSVGHGADCGDGRGSPSISKQLWALASRMLSARAACQWQELFCVRSCWLRCVGNARHTLSALRRNTILYAFSAGAARGAHRAGGTGGPHLGHCLGNGAHMPSTLPSPAADLPGAYNAVQLDTRLGIRHLHVQVVYPAHGC